MKNFYWIKVFIYTVFSVLSFIIAFNFLVDPYGKRELLCKNIYKPILNERAKKYEYIFLQKHILDYNSLILGSSRVMQIIPSHILSGKFYNFGVHVANNAEKLFILKEWIKKQPLKKVYFGIDFYNFHKNKNQTSLNTDRFEKKYSKNHLSLETLNLSVKTLKYQFQNNPQVYFAKDGEIVYYSDDNNIKQNIFDFSDEKYKNGAYSNYIQNYSNDKFEIDYDVFHILNQVKQLSQQHNFELIVFITPSHLFDIQLFLEDKALCDKFNIIRQNLKDIFGTIYDFSEDQYYNSINENYYDVYHFTSYLGDEIIRTIEKNGDFGQILYSKGNN